MNLDPRDPNGARNRLLVKLLGGLVVAGVVIGLGVGILGTTALKSMGLKEQPPPAPTAEPHGIDLPTPQTDDTDTEPSDDDSEDIDGDADGHRPNGTRPPTVLHAQPNPASPGTEITLSGSFRRLHGGTLQVQRREGGVWADFPVTATVNPNGTFSTYIITSRTGTSPYRLLDEATGRSTPPVRITIG